MISVIIGSSWSIHLFRSHVGIGSRSHAWDAVSNSYKYYILARTTKHKLYFLIYRSEHTVCYIENTLIINGI